MFVLLRRLLIATIAVIFLLVAAVLAYVNPDPIPLDIGLIRFERVSVSLVVVSSFVIGTVFSGLLFSFMLFNQYRERSILRRDLNRAEKELQTTRSLLSDDAD